MVENRHHTALAAIARRVDTKAYFEYSLAHLAEIVCLAYETAGSKIAPCPRLRIIWFAVPRRLRNACRCSLGSS